MKLQLTIPDSFNSLALEKREYGKQAFIYREEKLLEKVCDYYGRSPDDLCLKVFHGNPLGKGETLENALWGDNHDTSDPNKVRRNTNLLVGTKIQNILWWNKLAPRVYAVFEIGYKGKRLACQLTDYVKGDFYTDFKQVERLHDGPIAEIAKKYHFSEVKNILSLNDVIDGKIIDVQQYAFDSNIEDNIKEIYFNKGRYGKVYYQDVPELGLQGGPRKSLDRIEYLKLRKIDFKDKVVWDVGSAGGFFSRYALDQGAKVVYAFDEADPCYSAFMLSNYLGYFNIDFTALDLRHGIPTHITQPDIVFYLSMNFHIGTPHRIYEADTIIFEDNGRETRQLDKLDKPWTDHYSDIEFVGRGLDHGDKAIYHLNR